MILVDMGGIVFSHVVQDRINSKELLRHTVLNTLLGLNKRFRNEYGEMVLCCEGGSWRRDVFPQYKAHRRAAREEQAATDPENAKLWAEIWQWVGELLDEWSEHIPWRVVKVWKAEADDIIGTLAISFSSNLDFGSEEKTVIVSRDKDFFQLQTPDVRQWDPVNNKFLRCKNPDETRIEHIIRGDGGDGIPNVLSDDDTFVDGRRQVVLSAKRYMQIISDLKAGIVSEYYKRNQELIDLRCIPPEVQAEINKAYETQGKKNASGLMNYLITHRCNNLLERMDQF